MESSKSDSTVRITVNLYAVHDRSDHPEGTLVLVAARGSEHALALINAVPGFDWTLGNTRTNRLWRNINRQPGIIDFSPMHHEKSFRQTSGFRSPSAARRRKSRKDARMSEMGA
jgi:hypothetical protein